MEHVLRHSEYRDVNLGRVAIVESKNEITNVDYNSNVISLLIQYNGIFFDYETLLSVLLHEFAHLIRRKLTNEVPRDGHDHDELWKSILHNLIVIARLSIYGYQGRTDERYPSIYSMTM